MKQTQADLYLETYQVLDIEIGRLREMQQWQSSAAFKVVTTMLLDLSLSTTPHHRGICKITKLSFFTWVWSLIFNNAHFDMTWNVDQANYNLFLTWDWSLIFNIAHLDTTWNIKKANFKKKIHLGVVIDFQTWHISDTTWNIYSGSLTTITIWEWGMMIPNAAAAVRRIRGFQCEIE